MKIKHLQPELINKIAAGEVVERPASALKELIENALDAQARKIVVTLKNGGIDRIQVEDDGIGMSPEDAELSLQRHTTSKISNFDDLYTLTTMGFRGEALSSIASVSDFSLITRDMRSHEAVKIEVQQSKYQTSQTQRSVGTTITVDGLFRYVPARKKFMKASSTEYNNCLEVVYQHALMHPEISWKVYHNDNEVVDAPKVTRLKDRIQQLFGKEFATNMFEVSVQGGISLEGFIGNPQTFRATKKYQYMYVNGRPVQEYLISKAVQDAYASAAKERMYPAFVLNVKLDPEEVDINVHPRKSEVKFENANDVFRLVRSSVKNVLVQHNVLTSADLIHSFAQKRYEPVEGSDFIFKPKSDQFEKRSLEGAGGMGSTYANPSQSSQAFSFTERNFDTFATSQQKSAVEELDNWRILGQMHNCYLLVEIPEGFLVIDQHAAAERVRYERLLDEYKQSGIKQQRLLVPVTIELSQREQSVLDDAQELLQKIGFDIEAFGKTTSIIHAVPQDLVKVDSVSLVKGIIDDIDSEGVDHLHSLEDKQTIIIKYAACRGAIMFNDALSYEEQVQLVKDIQSLHDDQLTCCHGRPFMKKIELYDLEKLFHRH